MLKIKINLIKDILYLRNSKCCIGRSEGCDKSNIYQGICRKYKYCSRNTTLVFLQKYYRIFNFLNNVFKNS